MIQAKIRLMCMCMYVCYWNYGQKSDDNVLEFYASPFMYLYGSVTGLWNHSGTDVLTWYDKCDQVKIIF